jgi:hypothetical protein
MSANSPWELLRPNPDGSGDGGADKQPLKRLSAAHQRYQLIAGSNFLLQEVCKSCCLCCRIPPYSYLKEVTGLSDSHMIPFISYPTIIARDAPPATPHFGKVLERVMVCFTEYVITSMKSGLYERAD